MIGKVIKSGEKRKVRFHSKVGNWKSLVILLLFLGLKPFSSLVLTTRNAIKLICILYDGQDTTKVIIQYNIVFIYYFSNVHLSPH